MSMRPVVEIDPDAPMVQAVHIAPPEWDWVAEVRPEGYANLFLLD